MDVQRIPAGEEKPDGINSATTARPTRAGALSAERVGLALGEWQAGELAVARSFAHLHGLSHEQLEDLYQETTVVLLDRPFHTEEHLRRALRYGMRQRALRLHRDERRRGEILEQRGPELARAAEDRAPRQGPELAALARDDRMIVTEFLSELDELQRRVFWLMAEGMRYRAIAPALHIPVNEARRAARACERRRESFQVLYDTGRLCGFRSQTIIELQAGASVAEELARGAFAHLEACASCRAEHRTNARRLRRSFQGQAAALLPIPVLAGRLGWLARLDLRIRTGQVRVAELGSAQAAGGVRERAGALLAGSGAAVKIAAGVATVAVMAGGAIGATHALEHPQRRAAAHAAAIREPASAPQKAPGTVSVAAAERVHPAPAAQHPAPVAQHPISSRRAAQPQGASTPREPGGFAYLGVPTGSAPAADASAARTGAAAKSGGRGEEQRGGGPFSP
jgi:RNA polymerase sigma factor (sigma-70 family)